MLNEVDQYGNLVTGDNSTVLTVSLATGAGTLAGPTSVTAVGGVASFDYLGSTRPACSRSQFAGGGPARRSLRPDDGQPGPGVEPSRSSRGRPAASSRATPSARRSRPTTRSATWTPRITRRRDGGRGQRPRHAGRHGHRERRGRRGHVHRPGLHHQRADHAGGHQRRTSSSPPTDPVVVSPATPTSPRVPTQPSATATAGSAFAIQPVISEETSTATS